MTPWLLIMSSPEPPLIPVALAFAVDVDTAAATPPDRVTETPADVALASDEAVMTPVLVMSSLPLTALSENSALMTTPSPVTFISAAAIRSRPSPSPSMPIASASACVPPSQTLFPATDRPPPVTATETAPASETADEVRTPELSTKSSPEPASIDAAREVASAAVMAADRPPDGVTATASEGVAEIEVDVITPSLVIMSLPLTSVDSSRALW